MRIAFPVSLRQDGGRQKWNPPANYYQLLPKKSGERQTIHRWLFPQIKRQSPSSLPCNPEIRVWPVSQASEGRRQTQIFIKMPSKPTSSSRPMRDLTLLSTEHQRATLCHFLLIFLAWIKFFGRVTSCINASRIYLVILLNCIKYLYV